MASARNSCKTSSHVFSRGKCVCQLLGDIFKSCLTHGSAWLFPFLPCILVVLQQACYFIFKKYCFSFHYARTICCYDHGWYILLLQRYYTYTTKTLLFSAHMVFEYLLPQMFATWRICCTAAFYELLYMLARHDSSHRASSVSWIQW